MTELRQHNRLSGKGTDELTRIVMKTLFLSHAHFDGELASLFSGWLERAFRPTVQVICTFRPMDQIADGMITRGIIERLERSDVALAFLTPHAMKSPWVYYEMGAAQALKKIFIPCMAGGLSYIDLPPQAVEYSGALLQHEHELERLMVDLSGILQCSLEGDLDVAGLARRIRKG